MKDGVRKTQGPGPASGPFPPRESFKADVDSGVLKTGDLFECPDLLSRVSPLFTEARFGPVPFGGTPGLFFDGSAVPPQPYPNLTVGTTEAVRAERAAEHHRQEPSKGVEG